MPLQKNLGENPALEQVIKGILYFDPPKNGGLREEVAMLCITAVRVKLAADVPTGWAICKVSDHGR
jgi:hypothetical protein